MLPGDLCGRQESLRRKSNRGGLLVCGMVGMLDFRGMGHRHHETTMRCGGIWRPQGGEWMDRTTFCRIQFEGDKESHGQRQQETGQVNTIIHQSQGHSRYGTRKASSHAQDRSPHQDLFLLSRQRKASERSTSQNYHPDLFQRKRSARCLNSSRHHDPGKKPLTQYKQVCRTLRPPSPSVPPRISRTATHSEPSFSHPHYEPSS